MNYFHSNPVEAGLVERQEHYLYSSAKDYIEGKKCGLLELVFLYEALLTASLKPMLRCKRSITTLKIEISESVGEVAVLKERKLRATGGM